MKVRSMLMAIFLTILVSVPAGAEIPGERLAMLGAPILMSRFTTTYPGSSANRNYNMAKACSSLQGHVVPAGTVFSFNGAVGRADGASGYRKSRVFFGNRIVEDYGGGVCQVASTLYNAVLRANLPVVESHRHGLSVPYVAPGQDATVAYGFLDLKWRNDTNGPVVIEAEAKGDRITVSLYGTRTPLPVVMRHRILRTIPISTEREVDTTLPPGSTVTLLPGQEGMVVESWIDRIGDGLPPRSLGRHTYRMSPRILRYGPAKP